MNPSAPTSTATGDSDRTGLRARVTNVPEPTWTADLLKQQLTLIRICTIPLMAFGALWAALLTVAAIGGSTVRSMDIIPPCLLVLIGYVSYRYGERGNLRAAAYTLVTALVSIGNVSLTLLSNAAFPAVVAYTVALSIATIVIPAPQVFAVAATVVTTALVAAMLHTFPILPQAAMPENLMAVGTFASVLFGLPYPMTIFWIFKRHLADSQQKAWDAAGAAQAARNEAEQHQIELERLAEQLRYKNNELGDFLYVVSHDMRAPLINLEGFARALQENVAELESILSNAPLDEATGVRASDLKEETEESLDFILRSVSKADFLVSTVLELSRIDTRQQQVAEIDLAHLVSEIIASLQFRLDELDANVEQESLPVIQGDPIRVHQVFANLLDNAVKYAAPERPLRVRLRCEEHPHNYLFSVSDNGVGIRAEDIPKVFRMFGRLGHVATEGDGVGLTTIKKIIERQNGRIWVESEPGSGSTFFFTWPHTLELDNFSEEQEDAAA